MARISKQEKERIRRSIIEHSSNLFKEHGYDGTSIEKIAKSVGIANGTIFNYFSNKAEIYLISISEGLEPVSFDSISNVRKEYLIEDIYNMIEKDINFFISLPKKVLVEIVSISLGFARTKPNILKKLISIDFQYVDRLENEFIALNIDESRRIAELIYSMMSGEIFAYIYNHTQTKQELLAEIKAKLNFILANIKERGDI